MEARIIFLANNNCKDVINGECSSRLVDTIKESTSAQSVIRGAHPRFGAIGGLQSAELCSCSKDDAKDRPSWLEPDDSNSQISKYFSHTCPDQLIDKEQSSVWAECLHSLASQLPESGLILDVLWPHDIAKYLILSENLELFGALKRLVEWHGAVVYFLVPDYSDAEDIKNAYATIKEWVDLLYGVIITMPCLQKHKGNCNWRGHVEISGSQETKALRLEGYSIEAYSSYEKESVITIHSEDKPDHGIKTKPNLQEGKLEFVTAVPFHHVPTYYLTHYAYKLAVNSQSEHLSKSRKFLNNLHDDVSLAYILRLRCGTEWYETNEGKITRSRANTQKKPKQWKDLIVESIANVTESRVENNVSGRVTVHQFLVHVEDETVVTYLMRDLSEFDGRIPVLISLNDIQNRRRTAAQLKSDESRQKAVDLIESLPHFTSNSLLQLECDIERVQIDVLEAWIDDARERDEKPTLTIDELLFLLSESRKKACERLLKTDGYFTERQPLESGKLNTPKPEYELDPSTHLERIALNLRHSQTTSSFTKLNSNENLGGLSPPTGQILTLDANEFLKHFNSDGTALRTDVTVLRPERSPSRRFQKKASKDLKISTWPECLRAKDHDVYYNCEESERLEKKCDLVKARLLAIETSSTCTLQQARSPPTITIIDSSSNQSVPSPAVPSSSTTKSHQPASPDTKQSDHVRPRNKRKAEHDANLESQSKRMLIERKRREQDKAKRQPREPSKAAAKGLSAKESRSQRHRRKLQEVVDTTLERHGMGKDDPLHPSCVKKLFTLTMCFAKDLKTSHNLREEMEKIAEMHVEQVILFEKRMKT